MRVVAHRHSQYALTVVFSGNFPGSKEQIATDASLLAILCQTLLFYLPGLIVHTRPATLISNVSASTPRVADSRRADRLLRSHKSSRFGRLSGSLPLSRSSSADAVPAPAVPATKPVLARTDMATSMATMIGGEQWDPYMLPSAARDIFESALAKEEQMNEVTMTTTIEGMDRNHDGALSLVELLRGLGSQAQRAWQFYYGVLQSCCDLAAVTS